MSNTAAGHWTVEIIELQPSAPHYLEGVSLGELRIQLNGKDEGFLSRPDGTTHWISLKPWETADSNSTRLMIRFESFPDTLPQPASPPGRSAFEPSQKVYEMALSEVAGNHRFELRLGSPEKSTITAGRLLALPEATQTDIVCPVCDNVISLHVPLSSLVRDFTAQFDGDESIVDICLLHPSSIPETKSPPIHYPFRVTRYWAG